MGRRRQHAPLRVLLNNSPVGHLLKESGGAISFRYAESWLSGEAAIPVSLSLPLREDAYRGEAVVDALRGAEYYLWLYEHDLASAKRNASKS